MRRAARRQTRRRLWRYARRTGKRRGCPGPPLPADERWGDEGGGRACGVARGGTGTASRALCLRAIALQASASPVPHVPRCGLPYARVVCCRQRRRASRTAAAGFLFPATICRRIARTGVRSGGGRMVAMPLAPLGHLLPMPAACHSIDFSPGLNQAAKRRWARRRSIAFGMAEKRKFGNGCFALRLPFLRQRWASVYLRLAQACLLRFAVR